MSPLRESVLANPTEVSILLLLLDAYGFNSETE